MNHLATVARVAANTLASFAGVAMVVAIRNNLVGWMVTALGAFIIAAALRIVVEVRQDRATETGVDRAARLVDDEL